MKNKILKLSAFLLLMATSTVNAADPVVVSGELVGATDVDVNGTLYDVSFIEGTCIALFDGCDEMSDFDFQTEADALAASQALLDQVLLDGPSGMFDSIENCSLFMKQEETNDY